MSHYQVTFKKVFTGIVGTDEGQALDRACNMLGAGMVSEQGLVDYFQSSVEKEPVKEILITEDNIVQFLADNFPDVQMTEEETREFIYYLESDTSQWITDNLRSFFDDEKDPRHEKVR